MVLEPSHGKRKNHPAKQAEEGPLLVIMVNESDLPHIFPRPGEPIGQTRGVPVASRKDASTLMKSIMSFAKSKANPVKHGKGRSRAKGRAGKKGVMRDDKVHFGSYSKFY
jgi:hypothetical protein